MITIDKAHKLIQKYLNITETPFRNLYYGKYYNMIIFNENNLISILKSIRLYLDSFKIFIKNNIDLIL